MEVRKNISANGSYNLDNGLKLSNDIICSLFPNSLLVDGNMNVLHVCGNARKYLKSENDGSFKGSARIIDTQLKKSLAKIAKDNLANSDKSQLPQKLNITNDISVRFLSLRQYSNKLMLVCFGEEANLSRDNILSNNSKSESLEKELLLSQERYDLATIEGRNAIEQLTRANQCLEHFTYVCSHDLKEPLRIINDYVDVFLGKYGKTLDEDGARYLKYIQDSSVRAQELTKDILIYSQLENKSTAYEDINCEAEIKKVIRNLDLSIKETNAEIICENLPVIHADRIQMFQVFQNLINNSIKFCTAKKPKIQITAEDKGENWLFSIKDNGIGIKKEYISKIFKIFQRLNRQEEYPGTGIGLSICSRVIDIHGGEIWVDSEVGEGSTFYFTLPKLMNGGRK